MEQRALYLLTVTNGPAVVVRAKCASCARSVAAENAGKEGPRVWRDPESSTCQRVSEAGISGVVLRRESE